MKHTTYRDGIGAGPLLRPDLRGRRHGGPGSGGDFIPEIRDGFRGNARGRQSQARARAESQAWNDVLDWLHAGGRVLLRDADRLEHAEEIRRAVSDDSRFADSSLVVVFGERSLILSAA